MNRNPAASDVAPVVSATPAGGTAPAEFASLATLARGIAKAPRAAIHLIGTGTAWSCEGEAPADLGGDFLVQTLRSNDPLLVSEVVSDARFDGRRNAGVTSYAGWPLRNREGEGIGVLAIYDAPHVGWSPEQRSLLDGLAAQAVACAELHGRVAELEILAASRTPQRTRAPGEAVASFVDKLIDSAPVAIYYADRELDNDWCNPAYRRMFGLEPDQSPHDWAQGVHPDDVRRVQETWDDFCEHPRVMTFEYRARDRDGTIRHYSEKVAPIDGIDGYVGTISDFTALITTRDDLRKVESLFGNTFDQAPIGMLFANRDGKLERPNQAFCDLLGFCGEELTGLNAADIIPAEDAAEHALRLVQLWREEVPFLDLERRLRRKDGSVIWVRSTTALVRNGERADCYVEYVRDITLRRQLISELARQRTLLETVIADLPVALAACDVNGQITHYNRAAATEMRWASAAGTAAESREVDVFLMDGITAVGEEDRPLARALRGETVTNLELTIVPHDSSPRTTLSSARRLIGPDGEALGAVAVIQDTTDRRYQELELERVNKELVSASREAGMAEVATNVLHNVGNILNSVNISSSLVAERVRQSKAAGVSRVAELLSGQGERLADFLCADARGRRIPEYLAALGAQLLADQRAALEELALLRDNLEHIKDTVTMQQSYAKRCGVTETVAVADLVEDSLRLNAGAFARHGVALAREFRDVPPISVDRHRVLQILVNLVRNAKYACDDTGRTDKLITLRIDSGERCIRISVVDNGIGIASENMSQLFRHGFTTRESGHGFGLHSGALAAQELGGSLHARSDGPGQGATFTLELPLEPPAHAAHA